MEMQIGHSLLNKMEYSYSRVCVCACVRMCVCTCTCTCVFVYVCLINCFSQPGQRKLEAQTDWLLLLLLLFTSVTPAAV